MVNKKSQHTVHHFTLKNRSYSCQSSYNSLLNEGQKYKHRSQSHLFIEMTMQRRYDNLIVLI